MSVRFSPSSDDGRGKSQRFTIPLTLTPCQERIDTTEARYKIIRAGRKFGKTTYGVYSAIRAAGTPNSVVWFIGPTFRQAKLIAWEQFKLLLPRESLAKKPNETDLVFTLKNGAKIFVMGSDNPDSLRGPQPDMVILEEAAMQTAETWHNVIRPNLLPRKGSALFITTPRGFNWFKDLEDKARKEIADGDKDWAVFHYSVYDNPFNEREEIAKSRRDCDSEIVWRQEYMAEYESSVGRVFSQFSDVRHCRPLTIPTARHEVARAIDYGMRDDTACLWGRRIGNRLEVYREHLQADIPASTQAELILNKTTPSENVTRNIISHDAAKQDAEMRDLTVKWHFEHAGVTPIRVSSRDKKASRHMIQQLINEDRLVIDPRTCPKLRKQLLAYEWKSTTMEKTVDGKDDACFVAGTMIATPYGDKPIETLKIGDKVLTPNGVDTVSDCGSTGLRHVKDYGFAEVTQNHPVFTYSDGFKNVDTLHYPVELSKLGLCELYRWAYRNLLYSMGSNTILWGRDAITSAGQKPLMEGSPLKDFMCRFGNLIQERKFRKVGTFTTKTATRLITTTRIWFVYRLASIAQSLARWTRKKSENIWNRFVLSPLLGTDQRMDESGTVDMLSMLRRIIARNDLSASFVESISGRSLSQQNSVADIALRNTDVPSESITNQGIALFVSQSSHAINIYPRKPVLLPATVSSPGRLAEVYNLTVKRDHCYFANGVLVSNCDALHYLVELFQHELFMDRTEDKPKDRVELNRLANLEYKTMHKYKIEQDEPLAFDFADSAAGYL